jgi:hypothetical protein
MRARPAAPISLASTGLASSLKGFIGEPLMTARELSAELPAGDAAYEQVDLKLPIISGNNSCAL